MAAKKLAFTVISAPVYMRTGAFLIDYFLIGSVFFAIYYGLGRVTMDWTGFKASLRTLPALLALWLYFAAMESSRLQATVGKLVFRLRVCDYHCRRISFPRAALRYAVRAVLGVSLYVMMWTHSMQGLHDLATKTLVLESRDLQNHIRNLRARAENATRPHYS